MEEQTTWRGHGFTLFVFAGIVFLCATFFVLGMLVGRAQAQKYSTAGVPDTSKQSSRPPEKVDFVYEDLRKDQPPAPTLITPAAEEPKAQEPPSGAPREEVLPPPSTVNLQVEAFQQRSKAEQLVGDLKKLGFTAFIIAPLAGERGGLYRVQVGPLADAADAEGAKQKLESNGYDTFIKK
jgi:cell division septation protein DedD